MRAGLPDRVSGDLLPAGELARSAVMAPGAAATGILWAGPYYFNARSRYILYAPLNAFVISSLITDY